LPRPSKERGLRPRKSRIRGDRDGRQAVEELVGAVAAQRDRQADGMPLAQLERRDGLARPPDVGLLARDRRELLCAASSIRESCLASPTPMLTVTLTSLGACMIDE
jgi:hypothetical protein